MAGCNPPMVGSSTATCTVPFSGRRGGAGGSWKCSTTGCGAGAGTFPFSKLVAPACSARRKASCTRLILFLTLREIVVVHRAAHSHSADDDGGGPSQPEQAPLAAHQQSILQ